MIGLFREFRYCLRALARSPGYAAAATSTLAFGIAVTAIVFSLLHAVVLAPLPYREPSRLAVIWEVNDGGKIWRVSPAAFRAWRERSRAFDGFAAFASAGYTLTGAGEPESLRGARVTPDYFRLLGVSPTLGRGFLPGEGRAGAASVVVLGHDVWVSRFGADPGILGRAVTLDSVPFTVIGVMPPAPYPTWPLTTGQIAFRREYQQFFVPAPLDGQGNPGDRSYVLGVLGRLRAGVTRAMAQAEIAAIQRGLRAADSGFRGVDARVKPLAAETAGAMRPALWLLFTAVGLVLAIGCANVASLQVARAEARRQEVAIRMALGAGVARLHAQVLIESLVVALAAGSLGVVLAFWGLPLVLRLVPAAVPRLCDAGVDGGVLAFAALVSVAVGVASGFFPALLSSTRASATQALGVSGRSASRSRDARRALGWLVICETALAVLLAVGATLVTRSFLRLQSVDPGFHAQDVLLADIDLPRQRYTTPKSAGAFFDTALARVRGESGVVGAALAYNHPLESHWIASVALEHLASRPAEAAVTAWFRAVSEGYFRCVGVPLAAGRDFDAKDDLDHPGVALVNESFVRRYFGSADSAALGRRLQTGTATGWWGQGLATGFEIVGVVRDVRFLGLDKSPEPAFYLSLRQFPIENVKLLVRADGDPARVLPALRRVLRELDPSLALSQISTMSRISDDALAPQRLNMRLMLLFGAAAFGLALLGVYGLLSYVVNLRNRELAIRIALGARSAQIARTVVAQGAGLVACGAGLGLAAAAALSPLLRGLLFGIRSSDPVAFLAAPALLALAATGACLLPAWRATRVDPMTMLKSE